MQSFHCRRRRQNKRKEKKIKKKHKKRLGSSSDTFNAIENAANSCCAGRDIGLICTRSCEQRPGP